MNLFLRVSNLTLADRAVGVRASRPLHKQNESGPETAFKTWDNSAFREPRFRLQLKLAESRLARVLAGVQSNPDRPPTSSAASTVSSPGRTGHRA